MFDDLLLKLIAGAEATDPDDIFVRVAIAIGLREMSCDNQPADLKAAIDLERRRFFARHSQIGQAAASHANIGSQSASPTANTRSSCAPPAALASRMAILGGRHPKRLQLRRQYVRARQRPRDLERAGSRRRGDAPRQYRLWHAPESAAVILKVPPVMVNPDRVASGDAD
jgi:hypothetical protein